MRPERDAKTGRFLVGHSSVGHRFLPGNSGLPGRPKGARNKLAEAMIEDLYQDWLKHGIKAIEIVRETKPAEYLRVVALLVSKCDESVFKDSLPSVAEEIESWIEERRKKAMLQIERMREHKNGEAAS